MQAFYKWPFLPFLIVSAIGRGMRFFMVAGLIHFGGEKMEENLRKWVDVLGWCVVGVIVIAYLVLR